MKLSASIRFSCALLLVCSTAAPVGAVELPFPAELFEAGSAQALPNSMPTGTDWYAGHVALCGDTAVATAANRADLFRRHDGEWRYQGTLTPPAHASDINSPLTVALEGETLVLGGQLSVRPDSINMRKGAAYVFTRSGAPGRNAWSVNLAAPGHARLNYAVDVTAQQHASAREHGWHYEMTARFVYRPVDMSPTAALGFRYGDGTRRYAVFLDINYDGNLVATLPGSAPASFVLTTGSIGATDYHTHEMLFDPGTQTVTYLFNGNAVHVWSGELPEFGGASHEGILWGTDQSNAAGRLNVHSASFGIVGGAVLAAYNAGTAGNPEVAPDPVNLGWTLNGYLGMDSGVGPQSPDPGEEWKLQATRWGESEYDPSQPHGPYDLFGSSLALSGDTLVVGAPGEQTAGASSGAAYVFQRSGGNWVREKLNPLVKRADDYFGYAVDIDGDTVIVGAPYRSLPWSAETGRAVVFERGETGWTQKAELKAQDGAKQDMFGSGVAVHGNRIAVGAPRASVGAESQAGAVYVFERPTVAWLERAKRTADPIVAGGYFGSKLDLHGDNLIVGNGSSADPGYYVFRRYGENDWQQVYAGIAPHAPSSHWISNVAYARDGTGFIAAVMEPFGGQGAAYIHEGLDYGNIPALIAYTRKLLYYPDALHAALPNFEPNKTAFRYKHLLYGEDAGGIRADHDLIHTLYEQAERDLAEAVEAELRKGLALNPDDAALGNLLLDIHHDRAQAEVIRIHKTLYEADQARIGPRPAEGFIIDQEIPIYEDALALQRDALRGYFQLLTDDLGVPGDPPLGYRIFRARVPERGLAPATYVNSEGEIIPVVADVELFSGYKDLALLFNGLRDYGRFANTLASLLAARKSADDAARAQEVIAAGERFMYLQGQLLLSIFPHLPPPADPSGIAHTVEGWGRSLASLGSLRQALSGEENILGFAPDFLMLITSAGFSDSFDAFKEELDPENASSPLRIALDRLKTAQESHAAFRGYEDEYADQMSRSTRTYQDRLFQIVGAPYSPPYETTGYGENPLEYPGSELYQQYISIQVARERIRRNDAEIQNLAETAQIEINRASNVASVVIQYGDKQARLTEVIAHLQAAQGAATALANSAGGTAQLVGGLANATVQAGAGVRVAQLEGQKERLAAEEQALVLNTNSAALVKTLLLGMRTLAVDSMAAALLLHQEIGRMTALYREKAELEARIAEANVDLASRYFADPIHRLWSEAGLVEANLHFAEAQRWLFYMVRAYEYKWNTPFAEASYAGRTWSADTLFQLRNAAELEDFYFAMRMNDPYEIATQRHSTFFSLRRHFFGLTESEAPFTDPRTGETHDAIGMFRAILRDAVNQEKKELVIEFSTVREVVGNFFVGPTLKKSPVTGLWEVDRRGRFTNKIDFLQVIVRGDFSGEDAVYGYLDYGGTSFIRNFLPGQVDPLRPDRLINEMTAYSTRRWYRFPGGGWRFTEDLREDGVMIQLTNSPWEDPPEHKRVLAFRERSVAATRWTLMLPLTKDGVQVVFPEQLNDIEIHFSHTSRQRP